MEANMRISLLAFCLCSLPVGLAHAYDSLDVRLVGTFPCGVVFSYAVAVDSARQLAFVGGDNGLYVLDVGDPTSPEELSRVYIDQAWDLCYLDERLYVAEASGLRVLSVADPARPAELGHCILPASSAGVDVVGANAYVANGSRGLSVISIADPEHPVEVGQCHTGSALDVAVAGVYAYVAGAGSGLRIVSVADPAHPIEVGYCATPNSGNGVALSGSFACVADGNSGLRVISISDPTNPVEVGQCGTRALARGVAAAGDYAYVVDDTAGLKVVSIADPAHPVEVGYCGTPGGAYQVALLAGNAYVADFSVRLRVISVADPAQPVQVGLFDPHDNSLGVATFRDYAYIADGPVGLRILSLSDPAHPAGAGHCDTPGNAYAVAVDGGLACVADYDSGLRVISVTDPAHPVEVGSCGSPDSALGVAVSGDYAYVAEGYGGLSVISVADPAHPDETGRCDTPGYAYAVAVAGFHAFVADYDHGLRVISVADPAQPIEVGYCYTAQAYGVAVRGDYAYLTAGNRGLRVVSIADPSQPVEVGHVEALGIAIGVAVSRDYAYVTTNNNGMRVISLADPANPVEVGFHEGLRNDIYGFSKTALSRGFVYSIDFVGLRILQFYGGGQEALGDLDVYDDSLDVRDDTAQLRRAGSEALGEFMLINTSMYCNPDRADGPSLSPVDSLTFAGALSGPGGTLDSIFIRNLPTALLEGQTIVCTLAVHVPSGLQDGDYAGSITIAGKDVNGVVIAETFYAFFSYRLGDLDIDNDSLNVVADTVRVRPRLVSSGSPLEYTEYALGEFMLANTSASYNPDTADGPSRSRVDSLSYTGSLVGPGGTIDSILILNLPQSLAQAQTVVCTLGVYVPLGLRDGDYSGPVTITGHDSLHYEIAETVYALVTKPGDLDIDNDSLDVVHDTMDVRVQPGGSPGGKARFMLVNTSSTYNPDAEDGPSRSPLREISAEAAIEGQNGSMDSVRVLNLPESLAVGQAVECTLALFVPDGESLGTCYGHVTISGFDTLGYTVRDSFVIVASDSEPAQGPDSFCVAPIPFKPHQNPGHDAIHFQGLTSGARVVVYDAAGQSVWSATENGDGHLAWKAEVASGIYVYLVVTADGKSSKVGKLSVIR
jgi:hypothetical protein